MTHAGRPLALMLASLVVGSCGAPPPGPTAAPVPAGSDRPTSPPPMAPPTTGAGIPRLALGSPDGTTWSVTEPHRPWQRTTLRSTAGSLEIGPSSDDGSVLVATDHEIANVRIEGSTLRTTASLHVPPGQVLAPACYAGDGTPVFADRETLALVAWTRSGLWPFTAIAFTTGECAPLADGRTLAALDGGALVVIDADGRPSPLRDVLGHSLSGGGGLVAITDPSDEAGGVAVREAVMTDDGALGGEIGRVEGSADDRIVDAMLSPDGRWLAVTSEQAAPAGPGARLRLYRVDVDGLVQMDEMPIDVGTRVRLLADP